MEPNNTSTPVAEPTVNLASSLNNMPSVAPAPTPVTPPVMTPPPVVPPTPPIMPSSAPSGGHKEVRLILPALLLVLIIGAVYYWYASRSSAPAPAQNTQAATSTAAVAPNVDVQQVNLAQATSAASKLPAGFPASIPVETAGIKESYKAVYTDHNVTQYTVSYSTAKSKDTLWRIYTDFGTANAFTVNASSTSRAQGVLDLRKGKDELNVVISSAGSGSLVQMTYLDRP